MRDPVAITLENAIMGHGILRPVRLADSRPEQADTLVAVQCYQGDEDRAKDLMDWWLQHNNHVLLLSAENSRVEITNDPRIECRWGGEHGWRGRQTVTQQIEHMGILLEYPSSWYMWNETDSYCLTVDLPQYVYDEPDVFWCNVIGDTTINLHRPYMVSRPLLERLYALTQEPPSRERFDEMMGMSRRNELNSGAWKWSGTEWLEHEIPEWRDGGYFDSHDGEGKPAPLGTWEDSAIPDGFFTHLLRYAGVKVKCYLDGATSWPSEPVGRVPVSNVYAAAHNGARMIHGPKSSSRVETLVEEFRTGLADNDPSSFSVKIELLD